MLQEKRNRKPPQIYIPTNLENRVSKKDKPLEKKKRLSSCTYQVVPIPSKYNYQDNETLLLYSNVTVIERNNNLYTDFSLLNEYHIYQNIQITEQSGQKMVSISVERRSDVRFARWKSSAKKMKNTKEPSLKIWGKTIKNFSLQYENTMERYWKQIKKSALEVDYEEKLRLLREEADEKKKELLDMYPCIQLRTFFRGYENRLYEIIVNEKLLQLLGYSLDTFTSLILTEGFPQLIPLNSQGNTEFLKNVLNSYAGRKEMDFCTPEFDCPLLTKVGYTRNVKVEIQILMNHQNVDQGNDTLFIIKNPISLQYPLKSPFEISEDFLDTVCRKEKEISKFLLDFYRFPTIFQYSNLNKICGIKDLDAGTLVLI